MSCVCRFFFFLNKRSIIQFCRWGGCGSHNWSNFVDVTNFWPLNGLKLQSIQLLQAIVSFSTSNQLHFDCQWTYNQQPPAPPSPPIHWWPNKRTCYFQLALNFSCEENCGLMNIASWLASSKTLWTRKCNRCSSQSLLPRTSGIPFCCFQWPELHLN